MTSTKDKLTLQAMKQHDKIHPKFKATTGGGGSGEAGTSKSRLSVGAPSETARRRTTSVLSDNAPKVTSPNKSSMSIFRLVAATRTWQRLAKRKREAAVPIRLENTYQLEPDARTRFSPSKVEAILKEVLESRLRNVNYNPEQCRRVTTDLATIIKNRAKKLEFQRYKLVCNVLIMENKGQGSQVVSRGLTNTDTDSFAAYTYRNPSLIAVANVHGIYYE
ncbi:dynein light chain Tctex-type protein 2B-like isoform X2 [Littorina saxatilis]|uniref:Uncharacterized protein n=1 Tax=Littorina saxatilis TaxID=31220 RepID=A0AAN9AIU2_9CAEN